MTGLFDANLGPSARVTQSHLGLFRRVRHADTSFVVDAENEVGLVLNLSDMHLVERSMTRSTGREAPRVGSVSILPPGCRARFTITGTCRVMLLRLSWFGMVCAAIEYLGLDPSCTELRPSLNTDDPELARLIYSVALAEEEAQAAWRLAGHLVSRSRQEGRTPSSMPAKGGVRPIRLRRVLDRIEDGLQGALPLTVLAREAGMSPFHFAREFARTTGLAPHRYVVRRRLDRAVLLLAQRDLPIADVARRTGFTDASHLARHMRHATGATPEVFRACVLP